LNAQLTFDEIDVVPFESADQDVEHAVVFLVDLGVVGEQFVLPDRAMERVEIRS
jgi:hypothetical protein